MDRIRRRLTYANVISTLCLFLLLGGGAYAAIRLPRNSVGSRQLKPKAVRTGILARNAVRTGKLAPEAATAGKIAKNAITTNRIRDNAVTGAKVKESTLGTVPSASEADSAATAVVANHAYTAYHDAEVAVPPSTYGTVGTLHIPQPGAYVILAKLFVVNHSSGIEYATGACRLVAPGAIDQTDFSVGPTFDTLTEAISLQVSPVLTAATDVVIRCVYQSTTTADIQVAWQKITAIQVAGRTTTGF